jgi:diaminohydroxyphosphoribosylaminopyrimidine deaminase / 5-amino-6-(5-phosphoribosylamino)uracil reductase
MLEAGAQLNSAALAEQIVDKLCLFYAPTFLGADGIPLLADSGRIQIQPQRIRWKQIENDLCMEAYLHDPWA